MRTIRKYSEEDRNNYLRLWQESGLTQQAFCQEHDLVLRTFNTWKNAKYPNTGARLRTHITLVTKMTS